MGKDKGELDVTMDWLMPDGKPMLREDTKVCIQRRCQYPNHRPDYNLNCT
jgi:hypothetical protein